MCWRASLGQGWLKVRHERCAYVLRSLFVALHPTPGWWRNLSCAWPCLLSVLCVFSSAVIPVEDSLVFDGGVEVPSSRDSSSRIGHCEG